MISIPWIAQRAVYNSRDSLEGVWKFSNGDRIGWNNWYSSEPNNQEGNDVPPANCGALVIDANHHIKAWTDRKCRNKYNYICQREQPCDSAPSSLESSPTTTGPVTTQSASATSAMPSLTSQDPVLFTTDDGFTSGASGELQVDMTSVRIPSQSDHITQLSEPTTVEIGTHQGHPVTQTVGTGSDLTSLSQTTTNNATTQTQTMFDPSTAKLSWGSWTDWTGCSVSCGQGMRIRFKLCDVYDNESCVTIPFVRNNQLIDWLGYGMSWEFCVARDCPVDGVWSLWGTWSVCTSTCGMGTQRRQRLCVGPFNGGKMCPGKAYGTQTCDLEPCTSKSERKEAVIPEVTFTTSDSRHSAISLGVLGASIPIVMAVFICILDMNRFLVDTGLHQLCKRRN